MKYRPEGVVVAHGYPKRPFADLAAATAWVDGFIGWYNAEHLDAARFLKHSEGYWPFEGDDWPDEFVGSETLE